MPFKLGISAINWVNENPELFEDRYSGEEIVRDMSELGYEGTEMSRKFPRDPDALRTMLSKYGMALASSWKSVLFSDISRRDQELADFRSHTDFLKRMKAEHVIVCEIRDSYGGPNNAYVTPLTDEEWEHMVEGLHQAGKYCRDQGMKLVYHFHGETVVEREEEIDKLVAMTDPELVSLLFDTGHAYYGGSDPLELLLKHENRIQYIHLKDVRPEVLGWKRQNHVRFGEMIGKGLFTVPGDGCIDFAPIMRHLQQRNYDGWILIEAEQDPAVADSYLYAKKAKQYMDMFL